jgi:hypothetical protein
VLKVRNFQALYQFEGYVVEEFSCQEMGAQLNSSTSFWLRFLGPLQSLGAASLESMVRHGAGE